MDGSFKKKTIENGGFSWPLKSMISGFRKQCLDHCFPQRRKFIEFSSAMGKVRMDKILHSNCHFIITDRNIGFNFILVNGTCTLNLIEDNS